MTCAGYREVGKKNSRESKALTMVWPRHNYFREWLSCVGIYHLNSSNRLGVVSTDSAWADVLYKVLGGGCLDLGPFPARKSGIWWLLSGSPYRLGGKGVWAGSWSVSAMNDELKFFSNRAKRGKTKCGMRDDGWWCLIFADDNNNNNNNRVHHIP